MCDDEPQFFFWCETIRLHLDVLILMRSIREADFLLYREVLSQLLPMSFVMDHTNYGRWGTVHLRDMMALERTLTQLYLVNF